MIKNIYEAVINKITELSKLMQQDTGFKNSILQKTTILIGFIVMAILLYVFNDNSNILYDNRKGIFTFLIIVVPILFGLSKVSSLTNSLSSQPMLIIYAVISVYIIMMAYSYIDITTYQLEMGQYIFYILLAVAIIGFLAIISRVFGNYLRSLDGTLGFLATFIFYIPCMMRDFVAFILKEFGATTNDVYILFLIELAVILLIIYYPDIIDAIYNSSNNIVLLREPDYINKQRTIQNMEDLKREALYINSDLKDNKGISNNYAISLWVFVNPESLVSEDFEKTLFSFEGKPELKFKYNIVNNDVNDSSVILKDKDPSYVYKAYLSNIPNSNGDLEFVELKAPIQKWVNIVFNYNGSDVDVFVDGILTVTKKLEKIPTFSDYDIIHIGDEYGISGAICNIQYYTTNLSRRQISQMYNVYSVMNPPVL